MKFEELRGILYGTATVDVSGCGYLISNEDVDNLIDAYGDREVLQIRGNCEGVEEFDHDEVCHEGALRICLGD